MLKAAIYARYSSNLQRPTSIEDQTTLCRGAAPRFGCEVAEEHVYTDAEISGATSQRPGYQTLMQAAKAKQFDAMIVEGQDRIWRDQAEMHAALRRLRFWGVRVYSVETGADLTGKTGNIVATVMGLRDETFLDALREKTHRGQMGQVMRGYSGGARAFGYRSERIHDPARKDAYGQPVIVGYRRVVHSEEAAVVKRIFRMYVAGHSPKVITRQLNDEGVPPPRWRDGAPLRGWTPATIHGCPKKAIGILNNPLYIGRVIWNRSQKLRNPDTGKRITRRRPESEWVHTDVPDLRIVSDELWNQVQARRKVQRRYHRPQGGRPARYLFTGLLVCKICGSHYVAKTRNYYGCASNINRGASICPNTRLVRRDVLEERILRAVEERVFSPEAVVYLTRQVNAALQRMVRQRATTDGRRQGLETNLAQARAELGNVMAAIRQGIITPTTKAMLEDAEARVARLETSLVDLPDLPAKAVAVIPSVIAAYLKDLRQVLGRDTERARAILRDLLGEITLKPDDKGLVAVLQGNVPGILGLPFYNRGAGSQASRLSKVCHIRNRLAATCESASAHGLERHRNSWRHRVAHGGLWEDCHR